MSIETLLVIIVTNNLRKEIGDFENTCIWTSYQEKVQSVTKLEFREY